MIGRAPKRETIRILRMDHIGDAKKRELAIVRYGNNPPVLQKQELILEEDGSWGTGGLRVLSLRDVEHIVAHRFTVLEMMGGSGDPIQKPFPPVAASQPEEPKAERIIREPITEGSDVRVVIGIEPTTRKRLWTDGVITKIAKTTGKVHVTCADGANLRVEENEVKHKQRKPA